jgi:hypothetical protein
MSPAGDSGVTAQWVTRRAGSSRRQASSANEFVACNTRARNWRLHRSPTEAPQLVPQRLAGQSVAVTCTSGSISSFPEVGLIRLDATEKILQDLHDSIRE